MVKDGKNQSLETVIDLWLSLFQPGCLSLDKMTARAIRPSAPDPVCPTADPGMKWGASVLLVECGRPATPVCAPPSVWEELISLGWLQSTVTVRAELGRLLCFFRGEGGKGGRWYNNLPRSVNYYYFSMSSNQACVTMVFAFLMFFHE